LWRDPRFGVPKPGYRLLQLLHGLGGERLPVAFTAAKAAGTCASTVGALAGRNETHVLMVMYNQAPRAAPIRACTVRLDLEPAVRRRAGGRVELWRIDDANANPKLAWEGLGAPQWPSAAQNEAIFRASILAPTAVELAGLMSSGVRIPPQGVAAVTIPLRQ
jgi:xylan 1,4-beta-xylosidase